MATCAQKQAYLVEAEAAYHSYQMGGRAELISTGTKTIRYGAANIGDLLRYIQSLRSEIAACTGIPDRGVRTMVHLVPEDGRHCGPNGPFTPFRR